MGSIRALDQWAAAWRLAVAATAMVALAACGNAAPASQPILEDLGVWDGETQGSLDDAQIDSVLPDVAIALDATATDTAGSDGAAGSDVGPVDTSETTPDVQDATIQGDATLPTDSLPPCFSNADCGDGVCLTALRVCVDCVSTADCGALQVCQNRQCIAATPCSSDIQCKATNQVCDAKTSICVDCETAADCGSEFSCISNTCVSAKACASSKECPGVCDTAAGVCVECLGAKDCLEGGACWQGQCIGKVCDGPVCLGSAQFTCSSGGSGYLVNACDDSQFCNGTETCSAGACVAGTPPNCDDNSKCTTGDICKDNACLPGEATTCVDNNPCTADSCDPITGECVFAPLEGPCDDGNPCTLIELCASGKCVIGPTKFCKDDGDPCTNEACLPATGNCVTSFGTAPCVDGSLCTLNDACKDGKCQPGTQALCNDDNPCTTDTCAPDFGACSYKPIAGPCSDGNPCTTGDTCSGTSCTAGALKACNDGNSCTVDACDSATGTCVFVGFAGGCDDGDACTVVDVCEATVCVGGQAKDCGDGNPCTTDQCVEGTCSYAAATASCEDDNACTTIDVCSGGKCVGTNNVCPCNAGNAAILCNDNNPCTTDSCDTATSKCKSVAQDGNLCTDGSACTSPDICISGVCNGLQPKSCSDNKVCTDDTCDPVSGECLHQPNQASCSDNDACTAGDTCKDGTCVAGPAQSCSDADPCTLDSCNSKGTCVHTPLADGLACDDNNPCTDNVCWQGKCQAQNNVRECTDASGCGACLAGTCKAIAGSNPPSLIALDQTYSKIVGADSGNVLVAKDWHVGCYTPAGVKVWTSQLQQLDAAIGPSGAWRVEKSTSQSAGTNGGTVTTTVYGLSYRAAVAGANWQNVGVVAESSVISVKSGAILVSASKTSLTMYDAKTLASTWTAATPGGGEAMAVVSDVTDGIWVLDKKATTNTLSRFTSAGSTKATLVLAEKDTVALFARPAGGVITLAQSPTSSLDWAIRAYSMTGAKIGEVTRPKAGAFVHLLPLSVGEFLLLEGSSNSTVSAIGWDGKLLSTTTAGLVEPLDGSMQGLATSSAGVLGLGRKSLGGSYLVPLLVAGRRSCDCANNEQCDSGAPCKTGVCALGQCVHTASAETTCFESGVCSGLGQCNVPTCGNESCDDGEDWVTCPEDCPAVGLGCQGKCGSAAGPVGHCGEACSCAPGCAKAGNCCPDKWRWCGG